tara:strand:- start:1888 stop:2658 length:771 start_codon:yes stop_codon:yes gene_type:complete
MLNTTKQFANNCPTKNSKEGRFGVYFAPSGSSLLNTLGSGWLGRDTTKKKKTLQPIVSGLSAQRLCELTQSPRHYGFHATLKAPFQLVNWGERDGLDRAIETVCAPIKPFSISLVINQLAGFFALTLGTHSPKIHHLADVLVSELDIFRSPNTSEDIQRRRAAGLNSQQNNNLLRWGYPYVFSEFRFHMTLTSRITSEEERKRLETAARVHFLPILKKKIMVNSVCLFYQTDKNSQFELIKRFKLGENGPKGTQRK